MKNFTKNFIVIMFFGIIAIIMLTNDILRTNPSVPVFAPAKAANTVAWHEEFVAEMLSPDEIDVDGVFTQRIGGGRPAAVGNPDNAAQEFVTTVTTTVTSAAATATSAATSATETTATSAKSEKEENTGSYIKNPDYRSPYYIVVYTGSQSAVVYGKDSSGQYTKVLKSFTCSTGRKSSTPTRTGTYKIRAKYRWRLLMGGVYGQYCSSISSDYLFHSVPYAKQDPSTLYDASYNNLGKDVSHGCIRMCVRDCKWVYDNAPIGTQVNVVTASGPSGAGVPKRKTAAKYSGWDPSDQWAKGNPYFADAETTTTKKTTTTASTTTTAATTATASTTASTAATTSKTTKTTTSAASTTTEKTTASTSTTTATTTSATTTTTTTKATTTTTTKATTTTTTATSANSSDNTESAA